MTRAASSQVWVAGKRVSLRDEDLLGIGGEGRVYRVGDRALKIITDIDDARREKLAAFPANLPPEVVAPIDLATDGRGAVVGFTMRVIEGATDMHKLAQRRWQRAAMSPRDVMGLLRDLDEVVRRLHASGVVVGDLNDGNVALECHPKQPRPWRPALIDADSMQIPGFPCVVAHERFLDPRLYGVDLGKRAALDASTDWYALAVLAFTALVFVHPFGGAHPSYATMLRRAEARVSVLRSDVVLPAAAQRPDVLSDDALAWFMDVFERERRAPLPPAVLDAPLVLCSCGTTHARKACPTCTGRAYVTPSVRAVGKLRIATLARGDVLTATSFGNVAWVRSHDGILFREDGTTVPLLTVPSPDALVRLEGSATWVLDRGRARKYGRTALVDDVPIAMVHGEPAADVGPHGLVMMMGADLVRTADGTRIGAVLEGQTRVRVGASMGLAFARAGAFTLWFVFDPRRGPLRQIALPHLEGRLVAWDCVFDEAHALVSVATERAGHVVHEAHLVDARGEVVASERGTSSPVLDGVTGKCLSGGAIVVSSAQKLTLVRANRMTRTFEAVRTFDSPLTDCAELLVGPGGSLYALAPDELCHLSFQGDS